jgi:hypothetical protein
LTCSELFTLLSFLLIFLLWQILDYNAPVNALVLSDDADLWTGMEHYTNHQYTDISSAIGVKHGRLQFVQYYSPSQMQQPPYNPYPPSGSYQPPTVSTPTPSPPISPPITSNNPTISNQPSLNGPSGATTTPQSQLQQQVQQTPSLITPPIGSPLGAAPSTSNTTTMPSTASTFPETTITSVLDGNNSSLSPSPQNQDNKNSTTSSDKIAFTFAGTDSLGIAGFECSLDTPLPSSTSSPSVLASVFSTNNVFSCSNRVLINNLTHGSSHRFEVRAVDPSGNRDPTPATFSWTITNVNSGTTNKTNTTGNASVHGQQIFNNTAATGKGNLTTRKTLSPPSSQQLVSAPVNTSINNQKQMSVNDTQNTLG